MNKTTKTAQFTPGPWRISECQLGKKLLIQHGDENTLSPIVGSVYHDDGKLPQQAYAALIAAAPAMYAIIKDMREAFYVKGTRKALLEVMERSKDVLAQAEGR